MTFTLAELHTREGALYMYLLDFLDQDIAELLERVRAQIALIEQDS